MVVYQVRHIFTSNLYAVSIKALNYRLLFLYKLRYMLKMIMIRAIIYRKISVIALSPEFTHYEYVHVLCAFWNSPMHCWELECKGMVQC